WRDGRAPAAGPAQGRTSTSEARARSRPRPAAHRPGEARPPGSR
ncbi:MAG: hypothetical protein AVDCRST_MAG49-3829, partial [uncultured Thermomicrobiales bacterium]